MRKPAAILIVLSLAVLALALVPAAGLAAKGGAAGKPGGGGSGGGGGYTVTVSPAAPYSFGQTVNVTTDTPVYPNNAGPFISLKCYQDGVLVGTDDHAGFEGGWYFGWPFSLGPSQSWTSGAADCTITVFHMSNKRSVVDATTAFHVNA
jgi:hypothetical protein